MCSRVQVFRRHRRILDLLEGVRGTGIVGEDAAADAAAYVKFVEGQQARVELSVSPTLNVNRIEATGARRARARSCVCVCAPRVRA